MAYMFEVSGRETVPLRGEVDFLKNYLDLERLRLPAASDIGFSVRGDPGDRQIPPMLFVPLVENCFKHGLRSDGGNLQADIEIGISPGRLRFSTGNPAADVNPASGGTGLRNLRRRLALLYENRHTLHIDRRNRRFECTMEIWE
jgi:LytS/YehU family sensor histidine kinase